MKTLAELIQTDSKWIQVEEELFDFEALFGNANPVEIEIGAGKVKFLVARAQENPNINFLAVDRCGKWMKTGYRRVERLGLANVRFLRADFLPLLEKNLPDQTVSIFHIYFPDPWPKKKHQKRRILSADFLDRLYEKLVPQGLIEIATDDKDYFRHIQEAIEVTKSPWSRHQEQLNQRILTGPKATNYEEKWAAHGKTLHYIELKK